MERSLVINFNVQVVGIRGNQIQLQMDATPEHLLYSKQTQRKLTGAKEIGVEQAIHQGTLAPLRAIKQSILRYQAVVVGRTIILYVQLTTP